MSRNFNKEENFQEGIKKASKAYKKTKVSEQLKQLIEQVESDPAKRADTPYSLMTRALGEYLRRTNGELPVTPSLPDMTSTSDFFLRLQVTYAERANQDSTLYKQILHELLQVIAFFFCVK